MINFDSYTNKSKTEHNLKWLFIYSRSSRQYLNNRRFWIWKSKCIIKFNKQSTGYGYNLFVC